MTTDGGNRGTSRRSFLAGTALAGAGVLAAGCSDNDDGADSRGPADTSAPAQPPRAADLVPFRADRQAGVIAAASAGGVAAALDVRVADRAALIDLMKVVSTEIEIVMDGRAYERRAGGFPPLDTGILGPVPGPTGTSVIVGFGPSLFDDRFGLGDLRPDELVVMPRFVNDYLVDDPSAAMVTSRSSCRPTPRMRRTTPLRQVLRRTRGDLSVRWLREGFNTLDRAAPRGTAPARNLMGFKDGTANPDTSDAAVMDRHVWIQPEDGQPGWAVGGTFQAVRVIRMMVEFWDRTRLNEQETLIGRHRDSGAPLGAERETDVAGVRPRSDVAHRPRQPAHAG